MSGFEVDSATYAVVLAGIASLLGLVIYVVFYELFQRYGGRRVVGEYDDVALAPVMSGFYVEEPVFPSAKDVMVDVLKRSWRRVSRVLSRGARGLYSDWYFWAYIVLLIIVLMALMRGLW